MTRDGNAPESNARAIARRLLLAGTAALPAAPALAQQQRPRQGGGRGQQPGAPPANPAQTPIGPLDIQSRQAILVDFDTDAVLLEKNADERVAPSSMSKLMTLYALFQRLKDGRVKLDQEFTVSARARAMGGSRMFLEVGSTAPVEALIRGIIVHSGNDACVVVAENLAGSEQQFAEELNQTGRRLGMTNSSFRNATGWPDPEHRVTMRDLSKLIRRLIVDFPDYYRYFAERTFTWNNITQENRNLLLGRVPGADGLKTGHTEEAGFGLTASARRGDRRLILVVNGLTSMRARAEEPAMILEWGFREFENVVLFKTAEVVEEAPVYLGVRATVPLVFGGQGGRDLVVTLPRTWRRTLQARVKYQTPIPAPVLKGQELGRLEVGGQGVPPLALPLLAGADVERLGLIPRIPRVLGKLVGS